MKTIPYDVSMGCPLFNGGAFYPRILVAKAHEVIDGAKHRLGNDLLAINTRPNRIDFKINLYSTPEEIKTRFSRSFEILLCTLCDLDTIWLAKYIRETPPLYKAGIKYVAEPVPQENWQTIPLLYESKEGDCEDLANALGSFYRVGRRINAGPYYTWRFLPEQRLTLYHIRTFVPNVGIEDPSIVLGMPSVAGHYMAPIQDR